MKLNEAIKLAKKWHHGQTDKVGKPYIGHLHRVASRFSDPYDQVLAYLHDLFEDTDFDRITGNVGWLYDQIGEERFNALRTLSKTSSDEYDYRGYIRKISKNVLASKIKRADLLDNMNPMRWDKISRRNIRRSWKYLKAFVYLKLNTK